MPYLLVRNDITKMKVDAIVNAAKNSLLGGGGVDGAIHRAAGPQLLEECKTLGGCKTGQAKITKGYNLPAKYVIHTVGPVWDGGEKGEKELLASCYRSSLALAKEKGCETVAFPLISAGAYGYPKARALRVAIDTVMEFLAGNDMLVYIVIFDRESFSISEKLVHNIRRYIDDRYADQHRDTDIQRRRRLAAARAAADEYADVAESCAPQPLMAAGAVKAMQFELDESFSRMLIRKIGEKGMGEVECYKKANIDRKLFSKIKNDINYRPKKTTVIAFAIALQLSLEETEEFLKTAGYALSRSNYFDLIIEYFIINKNYNVFDINDALFEFDQPLLGC